MAVFEESWTDSRDGSLGFDQTREMRCSSLNRGFEINVVGFALTNDRWLIDAVEANVVQELLIERVKIGNLVLSLIEREPYPLIFTGFYKIDEVQHSPKLISRQVGLFARKGQKGLIARDQLSRHGADIFVIMLRYIDLLVDDEPRHLLP